MSFAAARKLGILCALAVVACAGAQTAQAQDIPGYGSTEDYDPREMAMLPRYCGHTMLFRDKVLGGNNPEEVERWHGVFGDTFNHLHHYCRGIMKTNRAVLLSRDPQTRRAYLVDAVREFDYVLERATPDFVLLPEILTKKGEDLILLGKGPVGIIELERAASQKPDYWPPYARMSDYYVSVGDKQKAREVLDKGLSFSPDAQALRRRVNELGAVREAQSNSSKSKTTR